MYGIFYNAINNFAPKKGWGKCPDDNDIGTADDLERLRRHRNKISHVDSSDMTTADFNESVLDLIQVFYCLCRSCHSLSFCCVHIYHTLVSFTSERGHAHN